MGRKVESEDAAAYVCGLNWPERQMYKFPFVCVDAPGPKSLGRIEWWLEPQRGKRLRRGRYMIEGLYLWAKQTRDARYAGKLFEIECFAEGLHGVGDIHGDFLRHVWMSQFCQDHRALAFGAYPPGTATQLMVDVSSAIMIRAYFC